MKFQDYVEVKAEHWSGIREMGASPLHYLYRKENDRADTKSLYLGRAAHTAVLEPHKFEIDYAVYRDGRRAGKIWEAFKAEHESVTILNVAEYETALAIGAAVRAHPVAAKVLEGAKYEESITWADKGTGLKCKSRLDIVGSWLADLKTSKNVDVRRFGQTVGQLGYLGQIAMYSDGWFAVSGERPPVCFIAVESTAPHDVGVFEVSEDQLYIGQVTYQGFLAQVATCLDSGLWPGRYPDAVPLEVPKWVYGDDDADELTATVVESEAA